MDKVRAKSKSQVTPKSLLDRELAEALENVREGRVYGPFKSAEAMNKSLRRNAKKGPRDPRPK